MTILEKRKIQKEKIIKGLDIAYQKLLESKQQKNVEIAILKNNWIEKIKFTSPVK